MKSLITSGEYFKSTDGKLRYDSQLRQEMFRFIFSQFKSYHSKWNLFLCMENKENWMAVAENIPSKIDQTKNLFDLKPVRVFSQVSK